uniref:Uncharacterized protein n=1 Tax=Oryza meridionalis TaxID=40149 RepID=A0A0E0C499_9ORYZ
MFSGQRLHPWGELSSGSWNGEILSLPSPSTHAGFVLISEKQPRTPWCSSTVSMKKALASLTTLKSHLQQTTQQVEHHHHHQRLSMAPPELQTETEVDGLIIDGAYPNAEAVVMAERMWASRGALLRQSRMSSADLPCACSSAIILSWKKPPIHTAHGGAEAAEGVGGAELGDDPVVAVPLDDGPVEVEHHHHPGCGGGGRVAVNASGHLSCSDGDRGKAGRVKRESRSSDERTAAPD